MSDTWRLRIQLFAGARAAMEADELWVVTEAGCRASDVLKAIASSHPKLAEWLPACRLAMDRQYIPAETAIRPDAEFALIPPVSGG